MEAGKFVQLQPASDVGGDSEKIRGCDAVLENERTEVEKQSIPVLVVFSNELIWKTLGRCLNVPDLKCCRLVNRKFNQMVMDETKFKDRVVLEVKKKKMTPEEFGKTEENWKKIALNFPVENALNPSNCGWLYPLLSEVEFLNLRLHGKVTTSGATDFHPLLGRLLGSCKKLKSLALEPEFIQLGSCRMTSEAIETLEQLEQFEILQPDSRNRKPLSGCKFLMDSMSITIPSVYENKKMCNNVYGKLKNVKVYKSYFTQFRMHPPTFPPGMGFQRASAEAIFLFYLFGNILNNNCQHVQSFPFFDVSVMSMDDILVSSDLNYETPGLKAMEVDSFNLETHTGVRDFIRCLNSRPLLEQLDISCPFYDPENNGILSELIGSIARHRMTLKKLKLGMSFDDKLTDWIFLRDSNLRDLRLVDYGTYEQQNQWIRQVMTNVPKSIEKLYFKGALRRRGPQKVQSMVKPLKTEYFARLDLQLVTQLSIFNAGGLVDNQVAQFICKNFKLLRKLNLSDTQTDDEGFSEIEGLKGLQFLSLKLCGISDRTLKLIHFIELRYLDVAGNLETTVPGIKMTMKECPSLETLIIPIRESNFLQSDAQKICRRLKFLIQSGEGLG